jgi:hypothetical protein
MPKKYFTDDEMLKKSQLFALVCLGGMIEGFDYSEVKALVKYWSSKRRECDYQGGFVEEISGRQALAQK